MIVPTYPHTHNNIIDCGYAPPPTHYQVVFEASFMSQDGQNPKAGQTPRSFTQGDKIIELVLSVGVGVGVLWSVQKLRPLRNRRKAHLDRVLSSLSETRQMQRYSGCCLCVQRL